MPKLVVAISDETPAEAEERTGVKHVQFGLVITGCLPAEQEARTRLASHMIESIERVLVPMQSDGLVLGVLAMRTDPSDPAKGANHDDM